MLLNIGRKLLVWSCLFGFLPSGTKRYSTVDGDVCKGQMGKYSEGLVGLATFCLSLSLSLSLCVCACVSGLFFLQANKPAIAFRQCSKQDLTHYILQLGWHRRTKKKSNCYSLGFR